MSWFRLTPLTAAVLTTALFAALWLLPLWAVHWEMPALAQTVDAWGVGILFVVLLLWVVWAIERIAQRIERRRAAASAGTSTPPAFGWVAGRTELRRPAWNPFDPAAWYYGRAAQRLKQTFAALVAYSLLFVVVRVLILMNREAAAGPNPYVLPAGGGSDTQARVQEIRVQKVKRKKFILNKLSQYKFNDPDINNTAVDLKTETEHRYVKNQGGEGDGNGVGEGKGKGSGFGAGTGLGKVRFIRLQHSDRDWARRMGPGGDMNMLAQYAARTGQKIGDQTEAVTPATLAAFPPKQSPPLIYVCGQETFSLAKNEIKILRDYVLERHGMILGDNCGGRNFHGQFIAAMTEISGVQPVPVPLDDVVHRRIFAIPFVPIVVAHGGTKALGWKVDGRWVGYYHPGAMIDAWSDGHAGIRRDVWEACYELGVNLIFYAHVEYSKWLQAQKQSSAP